MSLIVWPIVGIYFIGTGSIIDLVHFLSVPLVISGLIIFKPEIIRKNIAPYVVLAAVITLLAAGYLIAFTQFIPHIKINWVKLPIAVYFLLSVYVILWLLDKSTNLILSFALRINSTTVKNAIRRNYH